MGRKVSLSALLVLGLTFAGSSWADEVFDAWGFVQNRDFFSQLPYEHIDPLSGNLLLTFTDLVLPGNAGFDLRIQRTYNSKIYRSFSTSGDQLDEDSPAGVGWTMHLGRVLNPEALGAGPVIEMPDGRRQRGYTHVDGSGQFITKEYWVYDANSMPPVLKLPNGVTYSFGHLATLPGLGKVRYVTEISDPFGNRIDVEYGTSSNAPPEGLSRVTQWLSGSVKRVVTFTYDNATRRSVRTLQYSSGGTARTWTYSHTTATFAGVQYGLLTKVTPPVGPSWEYRYNTNKSPRFELTRLTTPNGGQVDYSYDTIEFFRPGTSTVVRSRAMVRRVTSGRDVQSGTWDFDYAQGSSRNKTISTSSCSKITYTFLGIGSGSPQLSAWQVGLLESKTLSEGSLALEEEELEWVRSVAISSEDESVGFYNDSEIYIPLMEKRTVTRRAERYATTNSYRTTDFNDFGRPWKIVESGDLTRTTTRVFQYGFGPYIVDRVASESVKVAGDKTFTMSRAFDLGDGFMKSETVYGIKTTFTPDSFGNLARIKNANNNTTQFSYSQGVLRNTTTPEYTITRSINSDGTVASETQRGLTTRFEYDRLFRTTEIDPPAGNNIVTAYDNQNGSFRRVKRGSSVFTTELDGLGRVSGTSNSVQVKTHADWDACGRRVYQSYPFTGNISIGTAFEYDALGRLKKKTNTGPNTTMTYSYSGSNGIDVTIEDEEGRTTVQDWSAFGDPRDARLVKLTDANGAGWQYVYNTLGSQTLLNPPGSVPNRSWTFNSKNQLVQETHPESGTLTYSYRAAGNLESRTDAAFGRTRYHYDGNERLILIDRPGGYGDIAMDYDDSDNRTLLDNGDARSTFTYDGANRLERRDDVIGGETFVTRYGYDGNDNLERIDYPSAQVVQYSYDNENRITLVHDGNATFAADFEYHASGGVTSYRAGNDVTHNFTYDDRYRVEDVYDNGGVLDLRYTYDDVGNVTDIVDGRPGMNQSYRYDQLDRLTTANGFWGNGSFTYDRLGNMKTRTIDGLQSTHSYNVSKQRLTSSSNPAESFSYDANGNLIGDDAGVYTYTPENMLERATVGGTVTDYGYDGDNLRKLKSSDGKAQFFLHGAGNLLLSEFEIGCEGDLQSVRDYVYAGARMIASVNNKLSSPTPVGPADRISSTTPTLKWSTVPGATSYTLVVENTTDGTTPINLSGIADTSYTPTSALLPYKNYQWRVKSGDGANQSCFSDNTHFEIFTALLSVSVPSHGTTVYSPFSVSGWAIDRAASTGTGVDAVHVWAFPSGADGNFSVGTFLGTATLGIERPGVGAAFGEQFTPSGYRLNVNTPLPPGGYTLRVYARSSATGTFNNSLTVDITVAPALSAPLMVIDLPQPGASVSVPFALAGWAIDQAASTGTGVDEVHVWAFPPSGDGIFLGAATLGVVRPGVGAVYGEQFTPSGYQLNVTTPLPPGGYTLRAYARSTVTDTFNNSRTVDITVAPALSAPLMVIDLPQPGASVSVPFVLAGWATDQAASTGTGVDGVAVGAVYGEQFTPSGYQLNVTTPLPPGSYTLRVYARSSVTGTFNNSQSVDITALPPSAPLMVIDLPQPGAAVSVPFLLAGWAFDLAASTGTGVDAVHAWAFPPGGDGNFSVGIFLGAATLGVVRPGVGAVYGEQFTPSGYQLNVITPLLQGGYTLRVYARSTVTGTFNHSRAVDITVTP